jgi:hypothetical protein
VQFADDMDAPTAPGRPGNLTAEQEAKLKEMWAQLLDIFGVLPETVRRARANTLSSINEGEEKKKKKSRFGLFGSKSKDAEDEDKHGQTKEFEAALASDNPAELRAAFWDLVKHDNPDAIVLRYLRARKWDVQNAMVMLVSTIHWTLGVDPYKSIVAKGEGDAQLQAHPNNTDAKARKAGQEFLDIAEAGKSFIHGHDVAGRPVVYIRVRLHRSGQQEDATMERFTIYTIETTRLFLTPSIDTATIVFDMQDFSLANMDYAPVKFMIKCFEANYPESLGSVVVYKSPWIFQGVWKVIRGWLDPVVASKIHFENDVAGLEKFIGPPERIMKELGGREDYAYAYVDPAPGENALMQNAAERDALRAERREIEARYEAETATWAATPAATTTPAAGGAGETPARSQLAAELTRNYWKLDPYIRARTLYDRIGVLQPGGKFEHYPNQAAAAADAAVAPPAAATATTTAATTTTE